MHWYEIAEKIQVSKKPIITTADIARFANGNKKYASLVARRLEEKGKIIRIEKGKYITKAANIFSVASHIAHNSYLSFLSALAINGIGEQIPLTITVACAKPKKQITINEYKTEFVSLGEKRMWGHKSEYLDGWHCFVAEPEKAILDMLYFPKRYSVSLIFEIIKSREIDAKKLIRYAKKFDSSAVIKRLGYLLEKNGFDCYKELKGFIKGSHIPLDPRFKGIGNKNVKWGIIENMAVA